ncbi:MAG: hypothetical protein NDI60_10465 [Elusimicrobiales bacterium]|nr:hypothetical protein [Elusimicrobiales bacterium]
MNKNLIAAAVIAVFCGTARAEGTALQALTAGAPAGITESLAAELPRAVPAARPQTFEAEAAWTLGKPAVTAIKRLGIMKAAEKAAVLKCRAQGLDTCVAVTSRVTGWDHFTLTGAATARALTPVKGAVFTADVRWSVPGSGFNGLERLGVQKDAEDAAIAKCRNAGHFACFAADSLLTACDKYGCAASAVVLAFQAAD